MILVSFFAEDNVLSDEIKICYIFEYQSNENRAFRFLGDTRYRCLSTEDMPYDPVVVSNDSDAELTRRVQSNCGPAPRIPIQSHEDGNYSIHLHIISHLLGVHSTHKRDDTFFIVSKIHSR